jgi:autotransporter-associated beta strand protein
MNGAKLGLDTSGGDFTHGSAITNTNGNANSIGLRKLGANTLTLAGANTYTGGTSVEQGTLVIAQNFSMGTASDNSITISNAAGTTAGTDYGQLVFSGTTLTYGGSLTLSLNGTITSNQVFDLISFSSGSAAGNFTSISLTGSYAATLTSSGNTWTGSSNGIDFSFDTITGDLTATTSSIPEPSTWAMILGGLALAGAMISRPRRS